MRSDLTKRRREIIRQISQITRLRRGQLSEQYYERENTQGQRTRQGPYFVWQAWVKGKKRSVRVKKQDVAQVREDMEAYKQYSALCEELADVTEQLALEESKTHSKKNSTKSAKLSAKSSPAS